MPAKSLALNIVQEIVTMPTSWGGPFEEVALILSPEGQGQTWAGRALSRNHKAVSLAFVPQWVLSTICYLPPVKPLCLIRKDFTVGEPAHGPRFPLPSQIRLTLSIPPHPNLCLPPPSCFPHSPPFLHPHLSQCGQGPVREDRGGSGPEAISGTPHLL